MPRPLHPGVILAPEEIGWIVAMFSWDDVRVPAAIVWGESRGDTAAYRDHSQNPLGGEDRGFCQFSSKAQAWVTDAVAYHPVRAVKAMHQLTGGTVAGFGPWNYGPNAYGPRIPPPIGPRPARTLDLAAAQRWVTDRRNPFWRMHDANVDVLSTDLGMVRPSNTPYVSVLPTAPMRVGLNGGDGRNQRLQRELAVDGFWRNANGTVRTQYDDYFGDNMSRNVLALTTWMRDIGIEITPTSLYTEQVRSTWDALRFYEHVRRGR